MDNEFGGYFNFGDDDSSKSNASKKQEEPKQDEEPKKAKTPEEEIAAIFSQLNMKSQSMEGMGSNRKSEPKQDPANNPLMDMLKQIQEEQPENILSDLMEQSAPYANAAIDAVMKLVKEQPNRVDPTLVAVGLTAGLKDFLMNTTGLRDDEHEMMKAATVMAKRASAVHQALGDRDNAMDSLLDGIALISVATLTFGELNANVTHQRRQDGEDI